VLLDEPDASVDRTGIDRLVGIVRDLVRDGKMVAIAAHGLSLRSVDAVRVDLSAPRPEGSQE
jgi:energy-coupling factor transporter ATP-binding protein EcfA2